MEPEEDVIWFGIFLSKADRCAMQMRLIYRDEETKETADRLVASALADMVEIVSDEEVCKEALEAIDRIVLTDISPVAQEMAEFFFAMSKKLYHLVSKD